MSDRKQKTDFLFAQPSFLSGLARTLDIGGTFDEYNSSSSEAIADLRAMYADWNVVGQDLCAAVEQQREQQESEKAA